MAQSNPTVAFFAIGLRTSLQNREGVFTRTLQTVRVISARMQAYETDSFPDSAGRGGPKRLLFRLGSDA